MAMQEKNTPGYTQPEQGKKGDFQQLIDHVQTNPWIYIVGIVFVAVCVIAGLIYRQSTIEEQRAINTEIARALEQTTPEMKASELAKLADGMGSGSALAVYLAGEAAYDAGRFEEAKGFFERVRTEFGDSEYAPDAVEGLGYVAENNDDYETAIGLYQSIQSEWPESFAARRQPYNLGRCYAEQDRIEDAASAYQSQIDQFPNSAVATEAQSALTALRSQHPELQPDTAPPAAQGLPGATMDGPAELDVTPPATDDAAPADPADELQIDLPESEEMEIELPDTDLDLQLDPESEAAPQAPADDVPAPALEAPAAPDDGGTEAPAADESGGEEPAAQ